MMEWMKEAQLVWIEETGTMLIEAFDDGLSWQDFVDLIPKARLAAKTAFDLGLVKNPKSDEILCELLFFIIDKTDQWGPDGMIDPILKACVSAFLIGDSNAG